HISYFDTDDDDLKYAAYDGSAWEITSVDTNGNVGEDNSIVLDSSGYPHIAYYKAGGYELKYAFGSAADQPPGPFNLLSPADGADVILPVTCDWEDSVDPEGDDVVYILRWSTDPGFATFDSETGLTESEFTFGVDSLSPGTYFWKVRAAAGGLATWSTQTWSFKVISSGIDDDNPANPKTFSLSSPIPNPSVGSSYITFTIPRTCEVNLAVFDVKGRKITTLAEGLHQPGEYTASVSGLNDGVYIYRMEAAEFIDTKKIIVK
ncbi:MAG: T9SS type A sorting domain-containing protein, partial [bacterium]|nr:T9SS type A sorting domain-containing protein [bacterium]